MERENVENREYNGKKYNLVFENITDFIDNFYDLLFEMVRNDYDTLKNLLLDNMDRIMSYYMYNPDYGISEDIKEKIADRIKSGFNLDTFNYNLLLDELEYDFYTGLLNYYNDEEIFEILPKVDGKFDPVFIYFQSMTSDINNLDEIIRTWYSNDYEIVENEDTGEDMILIRV